jgi:hypothetical protein
MSKDAVNFQHPEYLEHSHQIRLVQDMFKGVDYAKDYLVQQGRETPISYEKRKNICTLRNFVQRSIEAFVGMIFRKSVQTTGLSDDLNKILEKVDMKRDLNMFSRDACNALVRDGKVFLGVDTLEGGSEPYGIIFTRDQIINWRKNEYSIYTLIVVHEVIEELTGDFAVDYVNQYRVYTEDGNVNIYREDPNGNEIKLVRKIVTDYDYIPVIDIEISKIPPLYDIAKLNVKHMNRTSLKDKYLDMAATPIPIIWGANDDTDGSKPVYVIGVDEAFLFTGTKEESDFQWRELQGTSINALQKDLEVIEEEITSGVIRAATSDSTTIKTATQSFYEAAEASNRVTIIAAALENGLNRMLAIMADLAGENIDDLGKILVNKDFNALTQNGQDLRLLWEVYLGGAVSIETFLTALDAYEVVDIGSVENELQRIKEDKFVPEPKNVPKETEKSMDNRLASVENNDL